MNCVEYFIIPTGTEALKACIIKEDDRFKPWFGGSCIGTAQTTIESARQMIFNHAISRLLQIRGDAQNIVDQSNKTLEYLGKDAFNLGQFKTKK